MCNHAQHEVHQKIIFVFSTAKKYLTAALLPFLALFATLTLTSVPVWAESVLATVPTGAGPLAIAINSSTNKIYVANSVGNNITVIDGATNSTITATTGNSPTKVAINAVTNKIYVANYNSNSVSVIDGATNSTTTVAAGGYPSGIAVNSATNKIYVSNYSSNSVTVIDGVTNSTTTVAAGNYPTKVAINPVTNKIYVVNPYSNSVTVIDGATNTTSTVAVGSYPYGIAVNPATNQIYVMNNSSGSVTVIDGATNSTSTVVTGALPKDIAINQVTNQIYVANWGSNTVTVIDGATNSTGTIVVGTSPTAIAINPVTNKIYAVNNNSNSVTVIDGATNLTAEVVVGSNPLAIAVNPVTSQIYVANYNSNTVTVIVAGNSAPPLTPVITSPTTATCTLGVPCSYQITATNNPSSFDVSNASAPHIAIGIDGFPPGLSVNPFTGLISGFPTTAELYWFDVTAANAAGIARTTVSFTINGGTLDTTPPTVPSGLTASAVSETQINLSWLPSTDNIGVTQYKILRKSCPASIPDCQSFVGPVLIHTLAGAPPVTAYSDTTVSVDYSYDYYVRACDAANNCSVLSMMARSTTLDSTAPSVPEGLTATPVSSTQINLGWFAATDDVGVTQYKILRKICPASIPDCQSFVGPVLIQTIVGAPPVTAYSDTSVSVGYSYDYYVQACDAANNCSVPSMMARATTPDSTAPTVPTGLTASAISTSQINLSWAASADNIGVTGYTIYRDDVQVGTATGTSYSDSSLASGTVYSYSISACDAAGNCSAQSAAVSATTMALPPPSGLTASAVSASQINLAWLASTDIPQGWGWYEVYRNGVWIGGPGLTSFSDTGLLAGTTYSYTVAACDGGMCSAQSSAVTATTLEGVPPTVPTKLMTSAFSTTQINLTWRASTDNVGVTGYKVYRNGVQVGAPSGTSYSDTGLTAATSYQYTVAACDAAGNCSAQSATVTGATKRK